MGETILQRILKESHGIIHVGAASGQEAETYAAHKLPVTWIEAIPDSFLKLCTNISKYPKNIAINALITDRDGDERDFHVASNEGDSSSIFEMDYHKKAWPAISYKEVMKIRTWSLDSLLAMGHFENHDAMVLDLQGAEFLALKGATELLKQVRFVQAEAYGEPMYAGAGTVEQIIDLLEYHGFHDSGTVKWTGRTPPDGEPYTAYQLAFAKGA